jgi:hypothetical protein
MYSSYSNPGKIRMTDSRSGSSRFDAMTPLSIEVEKQYTTDNSNAGIRILSNEENGSLFLWKTPNVAILQGEKLIRPASISVNDWMIAYFSSKISEAGITKSYTPTFLFPTMLSSNISGIVTIAKNKKAFEFFHQACESKSLRFSYAAVIYKSNCISNPIIEKTHHVEGVDERKGEPELNICSKLIEEYMLLHTNNQNGSTENRDKSVTTNLIESSNSGTYERLFLINITFSGTFVMSSPLSYPSLIHDALASAELTCVKEGKIPCLSLVEISAEVRGERSQKVNQKTPPKFLKIMKREDIRFNRLRENSVAEKHVGDNVIKSSSGADHLEGNTLEVVPFLGLKIKVIKALLSMTAV